MLYMVLPVPSLIEFFWAGFLLVITFYMLIRLRPQGPYICGVIQGESFSRLGFSTACLSKEVQCSSVLQLRVLHADMMCRHPGPLYALVCGMYQIYSNPTLDVSTRPQVGLLPLCCEADIYPFQYIHHLHIQ